MKAEDDDMREEYDFSGGGRGKYAERFAEGISVVILDPALAEVFTNFESVNEVLRKLPEIAARQSKKSTG